MFLQLTVSNVLETVVVRWHSFISFS